jgi:hypothetical protein
LAIVAAPRLSTPACFNEFLFSASSTIYLLIQYSFHDKSVISAYARLCLRDRLEERLIYPRFPTEFRYFTQDVSDSGVSRMLGQESGCGLVEGDGELHFRLVSLRHQELVVHAVGCVSSCCPYRLCPTRTFPPSTPRSIIPDTLRFRTLSPCSPAHESLSTRH